MKKFFLIVVIVFMEVVCAEIAKLCREKTHARLDKFHAFAYNVDDMVTIKAQSPWRDAVGACTHKRTNMRDANLYEQVDR